MAPVEGSGRLPMWTHRVSNFMTRASFCRSLLQLAGSNSIRPMTAETSDRRGSPWAGQGTARGSHWKAGSDGTEQNRRGDHSDGARRLRSASHLAYTTTTTSKLASGPRRCGSRSSTREDIRFASQRNANLTIWPTPTEGRMALAIPPCPRSDKKARTPRGCSFQLQWLLRRFVPSVRSLGPVRKKFAGGGDRSSRCAVSWDSGPCPSLLPVKIRCEIQ